MENSTVSIPKELYDRLVYLGIIITSDVRSHNVGTSDYSSHLIQPWSIWLDYNLSPFDADIVKRILRRKGKTLNETSINRLEDYKKIIHICEERIRQINSSIPD